MCVAARRSLGGLIMWVRIAAGVLALAMVSFIAVPSRATEGPWCVNNKDGAINCSIPSLEVCRAAGVPGSGVCWPNPNYRAAPSAAQRRGRTDSRTAMTERTSHWKAFPRTTEPGVRSLILLTTLTMLSFAGARPGQATEGPWCLHTKHINCSIPTFEMCRVVALPENGSCSPNPRFRAAGPAAPRREPARRRD